MSYTARGKKCYHDLRDQPDVADDFRQIRIAPIVVSAVKEINMSHAVLKVHACRLRTHPFQFLQFLRGFGHQIRCGEYPDEFLKVPNREVRLL